MAQKRTIKITSPRGSVVTRQTKNGSVSAEIVWNSGFARKKGTSI